MLRRLLALTLCGALAVATLASCGDSKAGGTGEFATVFATATAPSGPFDSDVVHWVDASGVKAAACGASSFPSFLPDDVNYTITVTPYTTPATGQSSPIATSNLEVSKVTLTLTPADTTTPALPARFATQFLSAGEMLVPGSNTVSVRVVSDELKEFMVSGLGAQSLTCSNQPIYNYRAVVSFEALEINTNRVATITAPGFLNIKIADFADK